MISHANTGSYEEDENYRGILHFNPYIDDERKCQDMKMIQHTRLCLTFFVLLVAAGAIPVAASSESDSVAKKPREVPREVWDKPTTNRLAVFDLEFGGGNPYELVSAIVKASGFQPNLIIHPGAESAEIPPLRLRQVTTDMILGMLVRGTSGQSLELTPGFAWYSTSWNDSVIVQVVPKMPPSREVKVFQLTDLLQYYKIEDITTAIQSLWTLSELKSDPKIQYHDATKLIFVTGEKAAFKHVEHVLAQLRQGMLFIQSRKNNSTNALPEN